MPKYNIGPLRINSRYPAINLGTLSYPGYYIYSVSNLTLLSVENISYKVITCILVVY